MPKVNGLSADHEKEEEAAVESDVLGGSFFGSEFL